MHCTLKAKHYETCGRFVIDFMAHICKICVLFMLLESQALCNIYSYLQFITAFTSLYPTL